MKNKKYLIGIFLLIILFSQLSYICCEEDEVNEEIDVSGIMGLKDIEIIGIGIDVQKLEEEENIFYQISFIEQDAFLIFHDSVEEIIFKNIIPQEEAEHPTYLRLDKGGGIIRADFTVNENGGNYTFEEEMIETPPFVRIYFDKETGLEIEFPEDFDFSKFPNLLDYFSEGYFKKIKGKNIELSNGIKLIDGELSVNENGFVLDKGVADYKQMRLDSSFGDVLIANENSDLLDYEGNWIKQTFDLLEMQSAKNDEMRVEFLENHEILNTDKKDNLIVNLKNGDGVLFEDRKKERLVPKVIHKSSENGEIIFENDKLRFEFKENEFYIAPPKGLSEEDFSKKYQSVAFELESDSEKVNEKIRINSYRQFVVLDKNDDKIVSYNNYGLPVSARIKDNDLQTLEQLRERYPKLEFLANEECWENEENFPPYMVYYTDLAFKAHPDAVENVKEINFGNNFRANSRIYLGRLAIDPSEKEFTEIKIREIENPLYVFQHEYEHVLDRIIENEEKEFEESSEKRLKTLYNELVIDSVGEVYNNEKFKEFTHLFSCEFSREYLDNFIIPQLESEDKNIKEIFLEDTKGATEEMFFEKYNEDTLFILKSIREHIDFPQFLSDLAILDDFDDKDYPENVEKEKRIEEYKDSLINLYDSLISNLFIREANQLSNNFRVFSGLPDVYVLRDYNSQGIRLPMDQSDFAELSAVYREQPIEVRKIRVQSANPILSNMYKRLTQLAFDSEKMKLDEYKEIMGEDFCERSDCLDKRCVEYKLLCCEAYPDSPNC